ncbi:hypothetical protein ACLIKD_16620 [Azonexus sp. IMCC34842]|uniref:hypothetical protein n=1 Tax=Azonexus sp. IMCC34842 TaxID=3420950 RepID=UPI003D1352BE
MEIGLLDIGGSPPAYYCESKNSKVSLARSPKHPGSTVMPPSTANAIPEAIQLIYRVFFQIDNARAANPVVAWRQPGPEQTQVTVFYRIKLSPTGDTGLSG